nr:ribosomal protein L29 [Cryptomonas borealis]
MSFVQFNALEGFKEESINDEILAIKKQLFELRLKRSTRQSVTPHLFKHNKRRIAQLFTLQSQRIYAYNTSLCQSKKKME